jgi:hypothetical protein
MLRGVLVDVDENTGNATASHALQNLWNLESDQPKLARLDSGRKSAFKERLFIVR